MPRKPFQGSDEEFFSVEGAGGFKAAFYYGQHIFAGIKVIPVQGTH